MGLVGDLIEARTFWSNSSWIFRGAIAIAAFLAVSSVASLADAIFHWKGFILDGIEFYQLWITKPISGLFKRYGLIINSKSIDLLILFGLYLTGLLRESIIKKEKIWAAFQVVLYIAVTIWLASSWVGTDSAPSIWMYLGVFILYLASPIVFGSDKEERFAYYFPGAVAIIVVLLLGAVNAGLSRPVG